MSEILSNKVKSGTIYLPQEEKMPNIHPTATIRSSQILGDVIIAEKVHIVNAVLRADEGTPFYVGAGSNIQDFAALHSYLTQMNGEALEDNLVCVNGRKYSIYIGERVTIAHGVLVHGPSFINNNTFIGFKTTIDGANIGSNVEIGAHAYIKRVNIPDNTGIAPNAVIKKPEDIEKYTVPLMGINEKIVKINIELAEAYHS